MFRLCILLGIIFSATASDLTIPEEIKSIAAGEAPYHVIIARPTEKITDYDFCGGSIISPRLVLTSGSCDAMYDKNATVRTASNQRNEGGNVRKIVEIIHHPEFDFQWLDFANDVALLLVDRPFNIDDDTEKVIELSAKDESVDVGQSALLTGTARTKDGAWLDQLMSMKVTVSEPAGCKKYISSLFREAAEDKLCATHPIDNTDVCVGNYGSPLVINNRQVGIVSANPGICLQYPGIYTKVSDHRDWIDQQIKLYQ